MHAKRQSTLTISLGSRGRCIKRQRRVPGYTRPRDPLQRRMYASVLRTPEISLRWIPVWRRNLLVWRKLAIASVLGNIADPLLYMFALGYGIGSFLSEGGGMKKVAVIRTRT